MALVRSEPRRMLGLMTFSPRMLVPCDGELIDGRSFEIEKRIQAEDPRLVLCWDGKRQDWAVIRHCEDGKTRLLACWPADELERIPQDLEIMRAGVNGRIADVTTRIEQREAETEKVNAAKWYDSYGAMMEHLAKLAHDTTQPRTVFRGIPGRRDASK